MAAGLALKLFIGEIEPGAEIVSVASTRDQARLVWDWAKGMIRTCPELADRVRIYQHSIVLNDDPLSCYKPVAAEAGTMHGANLHGAIIDELHTLPNRELVDVIETSTGARRQPLIVMITTAGWDRNSICYDKWQYAKRVCTGDVPDAEFLPAIWETDRDEDWTDEAVWRKANPNLGVSIKLDYLRAECEKAKKSPAYENTFRQLHCQQWTEQAVRFYPMADWDKCGPRRELDELEGQTCYAGLDLAERRDLAGLTLVFPDDDGAFDVYCWAWIPMDTAREHEKTDHVPYRQWEKQGLIELTPGDVIDHRYIAECVIGLCKRFEVAELAYDPSKAAQLITPLEQDHGIVCVKIPQIFNHLSEPMNVSLTLTRTGKLHHGNNPLLRWQAGNVAVQTSKFNPDMVRPYKAKSTGRIDNIVGLIMALSRAIVHGEAGFVYDTRRVRSL
jgi:phage terminase large subunit-like protein